MPGHETINLTVSGWNPAHTTVLLFKAYFFLFLFLFLELLFVAFSLVFTKCRFHPVDTKTKRSFASIIIQHKDKKTEVDTEAKLRFANTSENTAKKQFNKVK